MQHSAHHAWLVKHHFQKHQLQAMCLLCAEWFQYLLMGCCAGSALALGQNGSCMEGHVKRTELLHSSIGTFLCAAHLHSLQTSLLSCSDLCLQELVLCSHLCCAKLCCAVTCAVQLPVLCSNMCCAVPCAVPKPVLCSTLCLAKMCCAVTCAVQYALLC